jgi:uncharacterized coiled-coil protein SlyX
MECEHCKNKFESKQSLIHHKKTAKYCLELQGVKEKLYICESCNKNISTKNRLMTHYQSCDKYKENIISNKYKKELENLSSQLEEKDKIIEKQEKHIKELEDKLENIAIKAVSRPTTTNKTQINNFIQQLQPIIDDKLKESVDNLTIDHIKKGPEGYAQYALEYPLKDKMICVDYSRRKVKFKDKDGNVITDPEMNGLATKFFNSIKDKNKELICLYANELKEKLGDDDIMDTMVKIFDYKMSVDKGSEGEKTDFHHDFVRQMCSQTIKE